MRERKYYIVLDLRKGGNYRLLKPVVSKTYGRVRKQTYGSEQNSCRKESNIQRKAD